jgi:hypothetical protein
MVVPLSLQIDEEHWLRAMRDVRVFVEIDKAANSVKGRG